MSSTENAGARSQQVPAPETAGPDAVTPDAGTPAAPAPEAAALADPTADGTAPAEAPAEAPAPVGETPAGDAAAVEQSPAPAEEDPAPVEQSPAPAEEDPAPVEQSPAAAGGTVPERSTPLPAAPAPVVLTVSDPAQWGRVDEDGTVYVRTADGERAVGSWQAGDPAAGLAHFGRRYDDLATEVSLLEARLKAHTGNPSEIRAKVQALADSIPTATAVGDLDGLAARARAMIGAADSAAAESRAEKAAARAAQVARKDALAAEAEQIGAESTSWKA
ncbi:MAG TPA: DUF349 domain-containing protein, partial [Geodermatophilus sp.]|nr:DUF349 domain-containing protein [Geodermatophilus sp.]